MYDFRSRLVHGDLDIPPSNYGLHDDEAELYMLKAYESSCLAISILTVTFQEMVLENKSELIFRYVLD